MPKRDDTSTRSWDAIADQWVTHADANDYRNFFLMPRMLALLGEVRGRRILDLGCGEGGYVRALVQRGASVTGVDGSGRLIAVAEQRSRAANLQSTYICANASHLDAITDEAFDTVVAAMALMDVEDYDAAIREAFRVLARGGELLMSITHPCFTAPVSEWERDAGRRLLYFKVDRYFERVAWQDRIAHTFWSDVLRRHRPLEDYMTGALRAGFVLAEFIEPCPTAEELSKSRRFAKIARVPYFLFLRWRKPARAAPG